MPDGFIPYRTPQVVCVESAAVTSKSQAITSSMPMSIHCLAKPSTIMEPQPTRIFGGQRPSTIGGFPCCTTSSFTASVRSVTGFLLRRSMIVFAATKPSGSVTNSEPPM